MSDNPQVRAEDIAWLTGAVEKAEQFGACRQGRRLLAALQRPETREPVARCPECGGLDGNISSHKATCSRYPFDSPLVVTGAFSTKTTAFAALPESAEPPSPQAATHTLSNSGDMPPLCPKCRVPWAAGCSLPDCGQTAEPPSGQGVTAEDERDALRWQAARTFGVRLLYGQGDGWRYDADADADADATIAQERSTDAPALTASPRVREWTMDADDLAKQFCTRLHPRDEIVLGDRALHGKIVKACRQCTEDARAYLATPPEK